MARVTGKPRKSQASLLVQSQVASLVVDAAIPVALNASTQRFVLRSRNGAEVVTDTGKFTDFRSWDLYGFGSHPRVVAAAHAAIERFGVGGASATARCGYTDIHRSLEHELATILSAEDAVLFPSRAQATFSIVSALLTVRDVSLLIDRSVSAPVLDAAALANLSSVDSRDLLLALASGISATDASRESVAWIEPVSKLGAHVSNLSKILEKSNLTLVADESFAFGFGGIDGLGNFPPPLLSARPYVRVIGFEALLGSPLCAVVGAKKEIDLLKSASLHLSSEVSPSPASVAAALEALFLLPLSSSLRSDLGLRSKAAIEGFLRIGLSVESPLPYPIIGLTFSSARIAREFVAGLEARGMLVDYVGHALNGSSKALVRILIRSCHSQPSIDLLCQSAASVMSRVEL